MNSDTFKNCFPSSIIITITDELNKQKQLITGLLWIGGALHLNRTYGSYNGNHFTHNSVTWFHQRLVVLLLPRPFRRLKQV